MIAPAARRVLLVYAKKSFMKRKLPSSVYLILSADEYPFLGELTGEMESMGISVQKILPSEAGTYGYDKEGYIITDCNEGAEAARNNSTGYSAFCGEDDPKTGFWDAECIIQGFDETDADFIIKMYERSRNIPWTILETERTIVRELVLDDIDDMYKLYAEPGMADYIPKLCESREEEVEFEKMYISSMYGFYGFGIWTILDRETGKFIGRAGITNRDGYEDLEVGYMLSGKYQHRGIATEVMNAIIEYARSKYGCERLNAFIDDENIVSVRFAERLGFKKCGTADIEDKGLGWYILTLS